MRVGWGREWFGVRGKGKGLREALPTQKLVKLPHTTSLLNRGELLSSFVVMGLWVVLGLG